MTTPSLTSFMYTQEMGWRQYWRTKHDERREEKRRNKERIKERLRLVHEQRGKNLLPLLLLPDGDDDDYCDTLKAFRIAQFSKNSKIQKITVKKIFFLNFDTGFLLIGVFRVYSRSFIAKLAKTKQSISSETNPSTSSAIQ